MNRTTLSIAAVLLVLIVLMQISLWHGDSSIIGSVSLSHQINKIQVENQKLQKRNQGVYSQIMELRSNAGATEARAREELGLVKPGEIFYRVVPENK